ncbi:MAG: MiaB/RimO family radical SAM methylthiotransferase [Planctomycetaceae bacterium]|nr:MiaB/RimO family radical SAM methylthiotransferase [Planctomycetaceae bacterium]
MKKSDKNENTKSSPRKRNKCVAGTFSVISLGCPKNLVDSERCVFQMQQNGSVFQHEIDNCETVVLNTCGFLRSARNESRQYIEQLIHLKMKRRIGKIIVRGCMPEMESIDALAEEYPEVDEWFGVPAKHPDNVIPQRHLLTEKHAAYLRIADGCDRHCSFCAIPKIRGKFHSEPLELLLDEAKQLAAAGAKELIVVAQETTFYGIDLYGKPKLTELLRQLEAIDGFRWIRLMYSAPIHFSDELIDLFADSAKNHGKLLPYIDMPLQHASDAMLKRMNRRITKAETETLLDKLRSKIDNLVLRTSLMAGFPGETDDMLAELVQFVERWKFERAGVFSYSAEEGTPAAGFSEQVPPLVIERRYNRLRAVCRKHSDAWAERQVGNIADVQIDAPYIDENGRKVSDLFIGRTQWDAPDIDPLVYVTGSKLTAGEIVSCEVIENDGSNLAGVVV